MDQLDKTTYVCTECHAVVAVRSDERPLVTILARGGQPNIRVVTVAGEDVHRCVLPDSPRAIRL